MNLKILVIESEPEINKMLDCMLTHEHHQVLATRSFDEAFFELNQFQPDLIICGVKKPGCEGVRFMHLLKGYSNYARMPVIIVSNWDQAWVEEEEHHEGADAYVSRPFLSDDLHRAIERALTHASAA